jgi:hypothetical protein
MLFFNEKLLRTQPFEAKFADSVAPTEGKTSECFAKKFSPEMGLSSKPEESFHDRKSSRFYDISLISKKSSHSDSPKIALRREQRRVGVQDAEVVSKILRKDLSFELDREDDEMSFSILDSPGERRIRRLNDTATQLPSKPRNYPRIVKATQGLTLFFARKIHEAFDLLGEASPRVSIDFDLDSEDSFYNAPSTGTFRAKEPSNSVKAACRILSTRLDKFAYRRRLVAFLKLQDCVLY